MAAVAWVGDQWGPPNQLGVPLDDRGLTLADGVFETVLVRQGQPRLLAEHLERWQRGAALLGLPPPPPLAAVQNLAASAVERSGIQAGALRLNWSRGSGGRGLSCPEPPGPGRCWGSLYPHRPGFQPLRVQVNPLLSRSASSPLSQCKTFAYTELVLARRQAQSAGFDDALLLSSAGGLCCGTAANLLVLRGGCWLTPGQTSGCLPGVMRGRALALGLAAEAPLGNELAPGEAAVLLNSLDCRPLNASAAPLAKALFEQLLENLTARENHK